MSRAVLLASLFFVSCEDPGKIGLNINPENSAILTKYKEFVLPSAQVQFDARSTLNSTSLQAGTYSDPDFGVIISKHYAWLGVQQSTPTLSASAAYVGTSISIQFSSIYGSESENQEIESFEVYQLASDIDPNQDYTRVDELNLGDLIGNLDILIEDKIDTLATDSLFNFSISDTFGQSIFDKLKNDNSVFEDDTIFNAFIKGIALIPSASNNKILYFNPSSFKVEIDYTEINSAGEAVERVYVLDLGGMHFYNLNADFSGTPLSGILPDNKDFTPATDYRYLQAGTMVALKLDYDSLFMFTDTIDNIVIQRASLSVGDIPINQPGSSHPFSLIGYFTDETNVWPAISGEVDLDGNELYSVLQEELVPPYIYTNPQSILLGLEDTLSFEATMSTFVQNLLDDGYSTTSSSFEEAGKMLLFAPTSSTIPQSSPSHTQTNYFKVHKDSIRLKIYYSIPNI